MTKEQLREELKILGVENKLDLLDKIQQDTLLTNEKFNLTAITDPEKFLKINIERFDTYSADVKAVGSCAPEVFFHVFQERTAREFRKITHRDIDDDVLQFIAGGVARVVIELKRHKEETLQKIARMIHIIINN